MKITPEFNTDEEFRKFMMELFKKGDDLYEKYGHKDYKAEFDQFKPDKIFYEKWNCKDSPWLGRYEFYNLRGRYRYRNRPYKLLTKRPRGDC